MLPAIARHIVFPIHERILRRRTVLYSRQLEASQWFSPDELVEFQCQKLRDLLCHAEQRTTYYRRQIRDADIDVRHDDPWQMLARLPLLSKNDIRRNADELLWRGAPGGVFPYATGGSSGEPLHFHVDRRRQGYDQAARIRTHRWFDVDIGDREIFIWGSPVEFDRTHRLKRLRDALFNQRLLDAFQMSPDRMDEYLDFIERFRPACLFGYPSSLSLLADHARETGRCLDLKSLRAVFVTGEVCFPHHRETIASFYGVPVADGYGSRDAGFIAHECPEGELHITAENIVVEIVKDGRPVPIGEFGEIVVTHLDAYAMPFIRYLTGDVGRRKAGRCACGRGLPLMDVVQGRQTDFLYLPDGTIKHALSVIYPLRELAEIRQFRITQHDNYDLTVEVVNANGESRATRHAVLQGLRTVLGDQVSVDVSLVDRIATTDSGKYRYIVSHARPARAAPNPEASG